MHEVILRDFFQGRASAADLRADLAEGVESRPGVKSFQIEDMTEEFLVRPEHLSKVCDEFLKGELTGRDLQAVGFCLIASDQFIWDGADANGGRVTEVANDWSAPEVNLPITVENVRKWRAYLLGSS